MLDLREAGADAGTNIVLIEPRDASVFSAATIDEEEVRCAPLAQVAADLFTGPGRSPYPIRRARPHAG